MKKLYSTRVICVISIIVIITALSSCNINTQSSATADSAEVSATISLDGYELSKSGANYEIYYDGVTSYKYIIYDNNDKLLLSSEVSRLPEITNESNGVVRIFTQKGNELSSNQVIYCNVEKGYVSPFYFKYVLDEGDGKIAFYDGEKLIVEDIFNKAKLYMQTSSFEYPISEGCDPILSAKFSEDGKFIEVSYVSGESFEKKTQTLELYSISSGLFFNSSEDFEMLSVGDSLEKLKDLDLNGSYLWLEAGRTDFPKVSTHYTNDGYMVVISYDDNNNISDIEFRS